MNKYVMFALVFITTSLFSSEDWYVGSVKNLYENSKSSDIKGRLLPTSKIEVLDEVDGRYKVKISGFAKDKEEFALYYSYKNRILVAGLSKTSNFDIVSSKKVELKEFENFKKLEIIAFVDKDNLTKDLNSLYAKADELYKNNCGICHSAHDKKEFTANLWPSVMKSMLSRTAITKEENYLVVQYLQKHAKDME
ncbi:cytochrome C [Aliarcobacter cryaerophilus]|uniref:cytochrome C n=1 Tax=Aliarcobacter cryaerophilus TaxID=28198 RepID=UPI00112F02E4|nr:cytochrome C [Aliarcobacter cryaerophilus]